MAFSQQMQRHEKDLGNQYFKGFPCIFMIWQDSISAKTCTTDKMSQKIGNLFFLLAVAEDASTEDHHCRGLHSGFVSINSAADEKRVRLLY